MAKVSRDFTLHPRETGKNLNQSDKPKTSMNFITSPMNSSYFTDKWTPRSPNPNTRKPSNFKNENMKRGKKNNNTCYRDTTVFLHTKLPLFPPRHSESLFNNTTKRTKNNFLSDRPINEKKKYPRSITLISHPRGFFFKRKFPRISLLPKSENHARHREPTSRSFLPPSSDPKSSREGEKKGKIVTILDQAERSDWTPGWKGRQHSVRRRGLVRWFFSLLFHGVFIFFN